MLQQKSISTLQRRLLTWYRRVGRDLPWRVTHDPYAIAVSEVMLQQTQVSRVIPKYLAWLATFPDVRSLARAPLSKVLKHWSGLGYNSRALRLRDMARTVARDYAGRIPADEVELETLPGFGPYTAGAVATFAFNRPVVIIDTNIRRVVSRTVFGVKGPASAQHVYQAVKKLLPVRQPAAWNHALMDLGATICVSGRPKCEICPVRQFCRAYPYILRQPRPARRVEVAFRDSDRFWRGAVIRGLIASSPVSRPQLARQLKQFGNLSPGRFKKIVAGLSRSGFIREENGKIQIAR